MQPGWAAAAGELRNKRMSEFVFQYPRQIGRHGTEAADWNTQLAIVDRARPTGSVGDVEEGLLGVEGNENAVAGRISEVASEIVVVGFEGGDNLGAEGFRGLLALIVENEVAAFMLSELGLNVFLALRFGQKLLHGGVGAQLQRTLPRSHGIFGVVGGKLGIAEHGVSVGGYGIGADGVLGVGQRLGAVARANQQRGVIDQDGRVLGLEAQCAFEIAPGLGDVAVFEFKLSRDEIGGRTDLGIAFGFQSGEHVGVNPALLDDL